MGADVYVLEIKVANGHSWRGGEYSKRECDYLFIGWSDVVGSPSVSVYACVVPLVNDDWRPSVAGKYYAPVIDKPRLCRKDRVDVIGKLVGWYKTEQRTYVKIDSGVIVLR